MAYNFEEGKSFFEFFNEIHASKVLSIGQRVSVSHYSFFDFFNAFVINFTDKTLRIKFKTALPELDFFPSDPIILDFKNEEKVYFLFGEIESVDSLNPLILTVKVTKVDKKESLRKSERIPVSLASSIETVDGKTVFSIVKNISLQGIKVNCKESLCVDEVVKISVVVDKHYSIDCKVKVVRKKTSPTRHEYGLEIIGISDANLTSLRNFISQIKTSY